jgi:two-component system, sensor histidine kinase YesM
VMRVRDRAAQLVRRVGAGARRARGRVRALLSGMSLLWKLILVYSLIMLVPTTIVGLYAYAGFRGSLRQEVLSRLRENVSYVVKDVRARTRLVESVGTLVAGDRNIKYFLYLDRTLDGRSVVLYEAYMSLVKPLVNHTMYFNAASVFKLSLYVSGEGRPPVVERDDILFSDVRLRGFDWYERFRASGEPSRWLPAHSYQAYSPDADAAAEPVFSLLQRVSNPARGFLGVVVLDVRTDDILSSLQRVNGGQSDTVAYACDAQSELITAPEGIDARAEGVVCALHAAAPAGDFALGADFLYAYERMPELGITVVCKAGMRRANAELDRRVGGIVLVLLAGLGVLIGATSLSVRGILKRLRQIVSDMNGVARGGLERRITVDRRDEIGQLAEDFNVLIGRIDALATSVLEKEIAQRDAQFMALQYQVNPHFIYNMLDVFRMRLLELRDEETAAALTSFAKMLRYGMGGQSKYSTLGEELDNIGKYVALQRYLYRDRLSMSVELPKAAAHARMLRFILQPIVENSIKHGLARRARRMRIEVRVALMRGRVLISIRDDGAGMSRRRLAEVRRAIRGDAAGAGRPAGEGGGIGLANISSRLRQFYGDRCSFRIQSEQGRCTLAELRIPHEE